MEVEAGVHHASLSMGEIRQGGMGPVSELYERSADVYVVPISIDPLEGR